MYKSKVHGTCLETLARKRLSLVALGVYLHYLNPESRNEVAQGKVRTKKSVVSSKMESLIHEIGIIPGIY